MTELDRVRGSLLGLAVGDALGAPLEFSSPGRASAAAEAGLEMVGGGVWEPGEWTDDTAMALALAESIGEHGLLDLEDVARRYIAWADGPLKDIGNITRAALRGAGGAEDARARASEYYERTGLAAGNGTVMRAAPIGLTANSAEDASRAARADAVLTHADPIAGAASAALCAALIALREGNDPLTMAERESTGHQPLEDAIAAVRARDETHLAGLAGGELRGVCWTTLGVALYALETYDAYEDGVTWVISLGGDTDTNAAVAGALLGSRDGLDAVPARWLEALRDRDRLETAAGRLAQARSDLASEGEI